MSDSFFTSSMEKKMLVRMAESRVATIKILDGMRKKIKKNKRTKNINK